MRIGKPAAVAIKTKVVVITPDPAFEAHARATFAASANIELVLFSSALPAIKDTLDFQGATVIIVDIDAQQDEDMAALQSFMIRVGTWPPVVAVTQVFDAGVARTLMQMKVADFLVKPVGALDLVEACARVAKAPTGQQNTEAQIFTFLPAVGGAGVTTLAIQTAMILLNSGARGKSSTCLVDLDFQHGACADYLDLEPRLNLDEIEPRPERLDRQLLEVMLSHHSSGLSVISAPNRPAEMRSFNPEVVTRLLDLVSTQFDYVVFDMPRTWFSWTDSVLHGSNKLYIVSEMTVPGLRHAKHLVDAISERLGPELQPKVIINRFAPSVFSSGLRKSDALQALGDSFEAAIPNDYSLVREAIDRGVPLEQVKPGNKITLQIKKLIGPATLAKGDAAPASRVSFLGKLKLASAR
jgi:pilus assembly protein CpaE